MLDIFFFAFRVQAVLDNSTCEIDTIDHKEPGESLLSSVVHNVVVWQCGGCKCWTLWQKHVRILQQMRLSMISCRFVDLCEFAAFLAHNCIRAIQGQEQTDETLRDFLKAATGHTFAKFRVAAS